jgi:hypothetical protein
MITFKERVAALANEEAQLKAAIIGAINSKLDYTKDSHIHVDGHYIDVPMYSGNGYNDSYACEVSRDGVKDCYDKVHRFEYMPVSFLADIYEVM